MNVCFGVVNILIVFLGGGLIIEGFFRFRERGLVLLGGRRLINRGAYFRDFLVFNV